MPRPQFVPTEKDRQTVRSMVAYGIRQEDIAKVLGFRSPKTLRKHFPDEIARGATEANAQVAQSLYNMATSEEEPAATIFWLKTRANWREIHVVETRAVTIPDFVVALDKEAA